MRVEDVINEQGKIISRTEMMSKSAKPWTEEKYKKLLATIPNNWKEILSRTRPMIATPLKTPHLKALTKRASRTFYDKMIMDKYGKQEATALVRWIKDLQMDEQSATEQWEQAFKNLSNIIAMRLRTFQFKVLHRLHYTNNRLVKFQQAKNEYCRFCDSVPETLIHMYWECPITQRLWMGIWQRIYGEKEVIDVDPVKIMLGLFMEEEMVLNLVGVIIKKYILECKWKETIPLVEVGWRKIQHVNKIEQQVYANKSKRGQYESKWKMIDSQGEK